MSVTKEILSGAREYYKASKSPFYSFLFVVPLMMAYELSAFVMNRSDIEGLRNGADVVTKHIIGIFGVVGFYGFSICVMVALLLLFALELRKGDFKLEYRFLALMLAEAILYAVLFGVVATKITNIILSVPSETDLKRQLVLSLGAGVYEELLFRVVLISLFMFVFTKLIELRLATSIIVSIGLSSAIFSGFHYIGPLGDPFMLKTFVYRFVAGVMLAGLYVWRGFGITAYTHSLYDLFIVTEILT